MLPWIQLLRHLPFCPPCGLTTGDMNLKGYTLLQMRDLDTGDCWYESDVPQALGVSDIFDTEHSKF